MRNEALSSQPGPVALEVDSSPDLEGATGADVAGAIVQLLERSPKRGKTRGPVHG